MFSWGQNEHGQLGLGDNRQRQSPQEIYTFPANSKVSGRTLTSGEKKLRKCEIFALTPMHTNIHRWHAQMHLPKRTIFMLF